MKREHVTREDLKQTEAALLLRRKALLRSTPAARSEHVELAKIYGALDRIEFGGYGKCVNCCGAIESRRIDAAPWEPHCETCAQEELSDVTGWAA